MLAAMRNWSELVHDHVLTSDIVARRSQAPQRRAMGARRVASDLEESSKHESQDLWRSEARALRCGTRLLRALPEADCPLQRRVLTRHGAHWLITFN